MKACWILFLQEWHFLIRKPYTYFIIAFFFLLSGYKFISGLWITQMHVTSLAYMPMSIQPFLYLTVWILPLWGVYLWHGFNSTSTLERLFATNINACTLICGKFLCLYSIYTLLWIVYIGITLLFKYIFLSSLKIPGIAIFGSLLFICFNNFLWVAIVTFINTLCHRSSTALLTSIGCLWIALLGIKFMGVFHFLPFKGEVYFNFNPIILNVCNGFIDLPPILFYTLVGSIILILSIVTINRKVS